MASEMAQTELVPRLIEINLETRARGKRKVKETEEVDISTRMQSDASLHAGLRRAYTESSILTHALLSALRLFVFEYECL